MSDGGPISTVHRFPLGIGTHSPDHLRSATTERSETCVEVLGEGAWKGLDHTAALEHEHSQSRKLKKCTGL